MHTPVLSGTKGLADGLGHAVGQGDGRNQEKQKSLIGNAHAGLHLPPQPAGGPCIREADEAKK